MLSFVPLFFSTALVLPLCQAEPLLVSVDQESIRHWVDLQPYETVPLSLYLDLSKLIVDLTNLSATNRQVQEFQQQELARENIPIHPPSHPIRVDVFDSLMTRAFHQYSPNHPNLPVKWVVLVKEIPRLNSEIEAQAQQGKKKIAITVPEFAAPKILASGGMFSLPCLFSPTLGSRPPHPDDSVYTAQASSKSVPFSVCSNTCLLSSVRVWGKFIQGVFLEPFDIIIHNDERGLPGSDVISLLGLSAVVTPTGVPPESPENFQNYQVDFLSLNKLLGPGNYWLELYPRYPSNSKRFAWSKTLADVPSALSPGDWGEQDPDNWTLRDYSFAIDLFI